MSKGKTYSDYAKALEDFELFCDDTRPVKLRMNAASSHAHTIVRALRICDRLQGEPSDGMINAAAEGSHLFPNVSFARVFKSMAAKLIEEVRNDP